MPWHWQYRHFLWLAILAGLTVILLLHEVH